MRCRLTVIFLQALSNMCVAVGVLPVTGQTLPFISYGGSSVIFLLTEIGVVMNISSHLDYSSIRKAEKKKKVNAAKKTENSEGNGE